MKGSLKSVLKEDSPREVRQLLCECYLRNGGGTALFSSPTPTELLCLLQTEEASFFSSSIADLFCVV